MKLPPLLRTPFSLVGISAFLLATLATIILLFWLRLGEAARISFGLILVFVYPGLGWAYFVWHRQKTSLAFVVLMSVTMSVVISPLTIYICSRVGVPITTASVAIELVLITAIGALLGVTSKSS